MEQSLKERPILFSTPMIRPVMDGRKTQTRRAMKPQPELSRMGGKFAFESDRYLWKGKERTWEYLVSRCPYGCRPGDQLWVREIWKPTESKTGHSAHNATYVRYKADNSRQEVKHSLRGEFNDRWRPSIHMFRWASRITLELTDVRVERVAEISEEDAIAEGVLEWRNGWTEKQAAEAFLLSGSGQVPTEKLGVPRALFMMLWDSINGKRPGCSWEDNPWCWCLSFRRI